MALSIHRIIPKLDLNNLHDSELDEYTQEKIDKINEVNGVTPSSGIMLYEDGDVMVFEDGEAMEYEG